jgi:GntR family transcriptional regulator
MTRMTASDGDTRTDINEKRRAIEEYLLRYIREGRLSVGACLPSSNALAQQFHVNRNVVRSALTKLSLQGVIYARKGKGFFVAMRSSSVVFEHKNDLGFSEIIRSTGMDYKSEFISCALTAAGASLKRLFQLSDADRVYHVKLLRYLKGQPLSVCHSHIPEKLAPGIDGYLRAYASINEILTLQYGYPHPVCESVSVGAVMPKSADMRLLKIGDYIPLLETTSVFSAPGVGPIEYYTVRSRGDRFTFRMELAKPEGG